MSRAAAHEALRRALAVIYPNICPFCGEYCSIKQFWHEECFTALPYLEKAPEIPEGLSGLTAVCSYEGTARQAVLSYKDGCFIYAAEAFALLIIEALGEKLRGADVIAAVPSSAKSRFQRGYAPAEKIAKLISLRCGVPFKRVLKTKPESREQKTLSAQQRRENAVHSFEIITGGVSGKRVLLIDDVCTTGATLSACARLLLDDGAAEVFGAVFAKTRAAQTNNSN